MAKERWIVFLLAPRLKSWALVREQSLETVPVVLRISHVFLCTCGTCLTPNLSPKERGEKAHVADNSTIPQGSSGIDNLADRHLPFSLCFARTSVVSGMILLRLPTFNVLGGQSLLRPRPNPKSISKRRESIARVSSCGKPDTCENPFPCRT